MHKRSVRFSILLIILTLFVGFGVSFVAPKPARAGALEDFVTRLTLGDFIRSFFEGLFGGTRGADDPYTTPTPKPPTATPTLRPPTATPTAAMGNCSTVGELRCNGGQRQKCIIEFPTNIKKWVKVSNCDLGCSDAFPRCVGSSLNYCSSTDDYSCCIGNPQSTSCSAGCSNNKCNPTATPTPTYLPGVPTPTPTIRPPTATPTPRPPTATPTPATGNCSTVGELRCNGGQRQRCIIEDYPITVKKWVKVSNCDLGCSDAFPRCVGSSLNYCSSTDDYSCCIGNPQSTSCSAGCSNNKCNPTATPTATSTVRPTATSVPNLTPTVTVGPGTPSPTPAPTNTPVPYPTEPPGPPEATATPTTQVGAPCYYNVKLVSKEAGTALPSALQTGVTEAGGCRTSGVRELVPSFFSQPSQATNQPEWPCTDATYVGEQCTQGIVTGQFICMGGPSHEIKGCYNRTSDAYQRVSIVTLTPTPPSGATSTPTQPAATPPPLYLSFPQWFEAFKSYIEAQAGGMSVSLTTLEDLRNNIPLPTPTRP